MADSKDEPKKEGMLLRALKLVAKTDWKSMVVLLTMFGGGAGYVVDWFDDIRTDRTQEGAYDLLATRLEELAVRVEACEADKLPAPMPKPAPVPKVAVKPEKVSAIAPVGAGGGATEAVAVAAPTSEPEPKKYEKARLPAFQQITQRANQQVELEQFIQKVKEAPPPPTLAK